MSGSSPPHTPDALIDYWKKIIDRQLMANGPFDQACQHKLQRNIRFNVRILTSEDDHELHDWEQRLEQLLQAYNFNVTLDPGVTLSSLSQGYLDDIDLLIVFPLSDDLRAFAVDLANRPEWATRMMVCIPEEDDGKMYSRLLRERYGVETVTLQTSRLLQNQRCKLGVDVVRECATRLMNTVTATLKQIKLANTVVILVHGIRTRGLWQGEVKDKLEEAGLLAIPTNYGKFDVLRFLLPSKRLKRVPIQRVRDEIEGARRKFPKAEIAVLAHSFGTYILAALLLDGHQFCRIAVCGCVVPQQFNFGSVEGRFTHLINEVGCRDAWPVLASKIGWGYGPSGSFGFNRGAYVQDRKHADYNHSNFLNASFCETYWLPYFCDGNSAVSGDPTAQPGRLLTTLDSVPSWLAKVLFYLPTALLAAAIILMGSESVRWVIGQFLQLFG